MLVSLLIRKGVNTDIGTVFYTEFGLIIRIYTISAHNNINNSSNKRELDNNLTLELGPCSALFMFFSLWIQRGVNTDREGCLWSESGLGLNQNMGFPLYKSKILYYPVSKFVLIQTEFFSKPDSDQGQPSLLGHCFFTKFGLVIRIYTILASNNNNNKRELDNNLTLELGPCSALFMLVSH